MKAKVLGFDGQGRAVVKGKDGERYIIDPFKARELEKGDRVKIEISTYGDSSKARLIRK
jgi:hypothetical protein